MVRIKMGMESATKLMISRGNHHNGPTLMKMDLVTISMDGKVTVAVPNAPGEVLVIRTKNNLDVTVELPIVNLL